MPWATPRTCCSSTTPPSRRRMPPTLKSLKCATAVRCTRGTGEAGAPSGERVTAPLQKPRKCVVEKKSVLAFAQLGERIQPGQLSVDDSRMAHDHAAIRHAVEKAGKKFGIIGAGVERIGPGKCRVGAQALLAGKAAKAPAQRVQHEALRLEIFARRASALAEPRVRCGVLSDAQERFADLRKDVDVLVAVDVVGRPAEGGAESRELAGNFGVEQGRGETARKSPTRHGGERQKCAAAKRSEAVGMRPERRGQG